MRTPLHFLLPFVIISSLHASGLDEFSSFQNTCPDQQPSVEATTTSKCGCAGDLRGQAAREARASGAVSSHVTDENAASSFGASHLPAFVNMSLIPEGAFTMGNEVSHYPHVSIPYTTLSLLPMKCLIILM
jgi:hypothetical protein